MVGSQKPPNCPLFAARYAVSTLVQAPPLPDMLPLLWSTALLSSAPLLVQALLVQLSQRRAICCLRWSTAGPGLSLTRLLPADGRIPTSQVTAQAQVGEAPKATKPSTFCCSSVGQIHLAIWTNTLCNLYKYILQYILQVGQINCSDWAEVIGLRSKGGKSYCWTIHLFMIRGFRQECKN